MAIIIGVTRYVYLTVGNCGQDFADLGAAHTAIGQAVDVAHQSSGGGADYTNDDERIAFLFKRYAALTSLA